MKEKKLQVFISSTYEDLKEERQAAVEAILSSGHIPAGMELFSAGDESQMVVIKRWIDNSDVYLLLLGGRYGSVEPKTGKGYTHLEFEYAVQAKKPLFSIVMSDKAREDKVKILGSSVIEQENTRQLKEFKTVVLKNLVKFWDDIKDIKLAIYDTMSEFSYRDDLVGWIPGNKSINGALLAEEIAKLTKENSELRSKIATSNNALYSGLSYEELEQLLKSNYARYGKEEISLFDILLKVGEQLVRATFFDLQKFTFPEKLRLYRIVEALRDIGSGTGYKFTEDGHKFYIKALMLTHKENK